MPDAKQVAREMRGHARELERIAGILDPKKTSEDNELADAIDILGQVHAIASSPRVLSHHDLDAIKTITKPYAKPQPWRPREEDVQAVERTNETLRQERQKEEAAASVEVDEKGTAETRKPSASGHDWPLSGSGLPDHGPGHRTPG